MTNRTALRHPLRLALVTTVALGAAVPAAFALTADEPVRPRLLPVESVRVDDAAEDVPGNLDEVEHAVVDDGDDTATPAPAPVAARDDEPGDDRGIDDDRDDHIADNDEDLSGNCDEAEHAADPACAGTATPAPTPSPTPAPSVDDDDDDRSGHDEADDDAGHDDDRSGRRGGDDDRGDDDRSGSNSGRG